MVCYIYFSNFRDGNISPGQESNCVTPKVSQHSSTLVVPLAFQV